MWVVPGFSHIGFQLCTAPSSQFVRILQSCRILQNLAESCRIFYTSPNVKKVSPKTGEGFCIERNVVLKQNITRLQHNFDGHQRARYFHFLLQMFFPAFQLVDLLSYMSMFTPIFPNKILKQNSRKSAAWKTSSWSKDGCSSDSSEHLSFLAFSKKLTFKKIKKKIPKLKFCQVRQKKNRTREPRFGLVPVPDVDVVNSILDQLEAHLLRRLAAENLPQRLDIGEGPLAERFDIEPVSDFSAKWATL